ncbi:MAG: hypothetical protein GTO53_12855, partial [Planctomycetales bacterium]|nr:hypothetical protein [Planctomycetales bacterium]NIM09989.1 hypothetical protein [Planctomycetales bacterium]NIN09427.1 hypothetical protein [Planctomycetales bacterium]NIN78534.1 hypothetical protein [Planctomycetales bacterium]NIO35727.1 hypothetical protein [Planctomycetales bacterium]
MMAKWLTHTLVLAFAYILAGRLGQLLAVPPNYATAVWPASGIALAGLLLLGSRVWPGIFLGAWVVNGWVLLIRAEDLEAVAATVKSTTSIACGVTLQALAAYLLIRWLIGHPNALTRERDILGFLALGGPLACLIGATWGVATLYLAGSIDRTLLAMNWWTWWVGDVIGVVIFTPLALICFARPRDIWQPRRLSVALPLCVTFVVTTLAFFYAQRSEMSRFEFTFERRVREVLQAIQERLAGDLDAVHSVKGLYASSVGVERTEFATFNEHLLSRHIGVQAMEWLPRVSRGERSAYEARARAEGLAGFAFTERDAEGELVVAGERDEYYPVFYVEPLLTNESAIGFDLASDPKQRRALELARDSGRQVASAPVTLVPKNGNRRGFRIFDPIYAKGKPLENVRDRRRAIQGFVLGVFRIDEIVEASQPPGSSQEFQITMTDVTDLSDQQVVYSSLGEGASEGKADQAPIRVGDIGWSTKLVVAEREWRVDCTPTASFFAAQADAHTWLILSGGLAFTG